MARRVDKQTNQTCISKDILLIEVSRQKLVGCISFSLLIPPTGISEKEISISSRVNELPNILQIRVSISDIMFKYYETY